MTNLLHRARGGMAPVVAISVAGALLTSASASAQAATPQTVKLHSCSIAKVGRSLGPTYVEQIQVAGVTCGTADNLIKAYNACRLKHGGVRGRCTAKVDGFSFKERRQTGAAQFVAVVTATNGRKEVKFTYSENF